MRRIYPHLRWGCCWRARGVDVLVLEKHADFLRDFRGDTIHPSTLEVIHELGLQEQLLALPHQKAPGINAQFGDLALTVADFSTLPTRYDEAW